MSLEFVASPHLGVLWIYERLRGFERCIVILGMQCETWLGQLWLENAEPAAVPILGMNWKLHLRELVRTGL
jgi:hypothetical protein